MATGRNFTPETGVIDCTATATAYKITRLYGGESIIIKSLATANKFHYIGTQEQVLGTRGLKLIVNQGVKISLPESLGKDNYVDLFVSTDNAGDDITYMKFGIADIDIDLII